MNNEIDFPRWEVFTQIKAGANYIHAGTIHASDKKMALQNARDTYTRRGEGPSIWVVPSDSIVASNPEDSDMLFDPSNDKIYRLPTFYVMPEGAKAI
jgi:ring-1,2-phenylacetyl-CoA epoxidase subunit PaaB